MERRGHIRIRTDEGRCVACEQPHTLDITYRCVGCDGEVCAVCWVEVRESGGVRCPECAAEAESGAKSSSDEGPESGSNSDEGPESGADAYSGSDSGSRGGG